MSAQRILTVILQTCALCLVLLLGACANKLPLSSSSWQQHTEQLSGLESWELSGRLNIREGQQSDSVNLHWQQQADLSDIRISSSLLGLGTVYIQGNSTLVTVERSGSDTIVLPGLDALSREYLGYDFPASHLKYWIRGLPAPRLTATLVFNSDKLLESLVQSSRAGQQWELLFDRYQTVDNYILPGRIRLMSQGVRLTFSSMNWQMPALEK